MIWLTWRQQRLEALIGGAMTALLAIFLVVTGLDMASSYQRLGMATCLTSHAQTCSYIIESFRNQFGAVNGLSTWFTLLPLVFGVLLAMPFVLELEQGTYRLVWTQGITRSRWVALKLGLLVAAALLISLALTELLTWWQAPFVQLDGSFQPRAFDVEGTVPLAYTTFAVALGLGVGTLLRHTVPAVAISLVAFLVLRLGIEGWLRPTYMPPIVTALTTGGLQRSDWILGQYFRDGQGQQMNPFEVVRLCGTALGQQGAHINATCLQRHGIVNVITYQPGARYWTFQGIETAIYLGLAASLLALTVWWVRERVS